MEHQDELLLKKRFIDLSRSANRKNIVTFSNFLNLNELNLFHQVKADMETACQLSGGYENAERQMIAFIPDALYYDWDFPIVCLHFTPAYPKYAEEMCIRDRNSFPYSSYCMACFSEVEMMQRSLLQKEYPVMFPHLQN